jgi:PAS domain S-box-containing protein
MALKREDRLSPSALRAEVRRLRSVILRSKDAQAITELECYREELVAQQKELIESQRLLELSRDRYADLFDFAPVAYLLLDLNGTIEDINLTGARLLRREPIRLIGFPFLTHVIPADRKAYLDHLMKWRRGASFGSVELTLKTRSGHTMPVAMSCRVRPHGNHAPLYLHAVLVDLTERKDAEAAADRIRDERRRSVAASEAKDRFLAVLSHELRTPLAPVLLTLGSLRKRGVPETLAPSLEMIRRNVQLEADLIDDLLDVTRITRGKLHLELMTVDVHAAVEDVVGMLADELRSTGLHVALHLDATAHHVYGDSTRLRQVLWNLLENAIRHTSRGGEITVRSSEPAAGMLRIEVADNGTGIDPRHLARVFEPFEQAESERGIGLGLGLAICKGIVEAHGGDISALSRGEGTGATFMIALPTASPPPAIVAPPAHQAVANGRRILVVEDDHDNAMAIADMLSVHGHAVTLAGSVHEALAHSREGFDVVVSDIGLPDGTGRDLIRQLNANGTVRGIALTGYGSARDLARDTEAGFSRHLTKPVDPDDLLRAIDELTTSAG